MAHLVSDFFSSYKLEHLKSIFDAEVNLTDPAGQELKELTNIEAI